MSRSPDKKLLGFQASQEIWDALEVWLGRDENIGKDQSKFLLAAVMEKLELEKIPFDRRAAMLDGRSRRYRGLAHRKPALNDKSNSKPAGEQAGLLDVAEKSAARRRAKP